ncbi:MAG TPA: DUF6666 family protein [Pirellulales bacterium]|nr:DUF6666 family protein [Pirellulales bacterium]
MKTNFWRLGVLFAVAALSSAGLLRADDDIQLTSNYDETEVSPSESVAATYATDADAIKPQPQADGSVANTGCGCGKCNGNCNKCGNQGNCCNKCGQCNKCCGCKTWGPFAEPCPRFGVYGFSGVGSFSGITQGNLGGNTGGYTGANFGGALVEDYGIGWQAGGSYGVYNWSGNPSSFSHTGNSTIQGFFTVGIFQRASVNRRVSWGVVQDWMIANNFGVFGNSMTLGQVRGQVAYAVGPRNEFGLWATVWDRTVTRASGAIGTPVAYQAIDQGNVFWHHKYAAYGADSWMYAGIPLDGRIATPANSAGFPIGGSGGSLGSFIVGSNLLVPINDRLSAYANFMYMRPSAAEGVNAAGAFAAAQQMWNVDFGMAFYPGRAARSRTVAGREWMPYMPVANNSTFLVDSTKTE